MNTFVKIKQIAAFSRLDAATERSLAILAQAGDVDARRQLVEANLSWVVSSACRFKRRGIDNTTFDDLVSEGTLGLYKALDKFDPYRGNRFSTYALPWVRVKMRHVLMVANNDSAICVPLEGGITAGHGEIDNNQTWADYLEDKSPTPEERTESNRHAAAVRQVLCELAPRLSSRDRDLIMSRLTLDEDIQDSLETVGKRYGVSRERARQCERRLKKLLRMHCRKLRQGYVDGIFWERNARK